MNRVPLEAYTSKVLDPVKHREIVARIDYFADRAGIAPHCIWSPLDNLNEVELKYLRNFKRLVADGCVGAFYANGQNYVAHMSAITGALVRGFIDGRMMTVHDIVEAMEAREAIVATVLLIPNFYIAKEWGNKWQSRKVEPLSNLLYSRAARGEPTIIHIESKDQVETVFGQPFLNFLLSNYCELESE